MPIHRSRFARGGAGGAFTRQVGDAGILLLVLSGKSFHALHLWELKENGQFLREHGNPRLYPVKSSSSGLGEAEARSHDPVFKELSLRSWIFHGILGM